MATKRFSGYLREPLSEYAQHDLWRFTHATTTGEVVKGSTSIFKVDETGYYDIEIQYGTVMIESKDRLSQRWINHGQYTISSTTTVTTLPALLLATTPMTPELQQELELILANTQAAADLATQQAGIAKDEADKAASLLDTKVDKDAIGTAASRNVMTSPTDMTTPNALMPRGAFGWGGEVTYRPFELVTSFGNLFANNLELTVPVMVLLFRAQPNRKLAGRVTCGRAVGSGFTSQYVIDVTCATNDSGSITTCTVNVSGGGALKFSPHVVTYNGDSWLALDTSSSSEFIYPSAYIFDGYVINEELKVVPRQECTGITPYQAGGVFRTNGHTVYHTGNAVAPVSQSGGVLTGGLMQYGETPNGKFWRYANNHQVCVGSVTFENVSVAVTVGGGFQSQDSFVLNFAAPFSARPDVTPIARYVSGQSRPWASIAALTQSLASVIMHSFVTISGGQITVHYIAEGPWY